MNSTAIQGIALATIVAGAAACGRLLPSIMDMTEENGLRYTDVSVEGAPPFVVLGTAVGALRGLIVDYLWIKVNIMKEKGLFYEVMADADLITKLQPRFGQVWAFHAHNMAYNISVATNTEEERWEWVNAGIRLIRNDGLRHNPNDITLYRALAFYFAHKIEGYSDDAHLYYKRQFALEWHFLLGEPPQDTEERIAWIKAIADAPATLAEAEKRTPGVLALVDRLNKLDTPFQEAENFAARSEFLRVYGEWKAISGESAYAQLLGGIETFRERVPFVKAFDAIAADPALQPAMETLLNHVRKRVLMDEYNMDPELMYEFTRDLGPIDWRHGQAHALYWSRCGSMFAEARVSNENDVYRMLNNDRLQLQAMQDLARWGRITYDPLASEELGEQPARFPELRWVDTLDREFRRVYTKYYNTRGGGGDSFAGFYENFLSAAIRMYARAGERDRAEQLLQTGDDLFGTGRDGRPGNPKFRVSLDVFVANEIRGEVEFQPSIAPTEAVASLRQAFRVGVGQDREKVWDDAIEYVKQITDLFKGNEYNNYVTKFGSGRMQDIMFQMEHTKEIAFLQLMTDPTVPIPEKATIWSKVDQFDPTLRVLVYDRMGPVLARQLQNHAIARSGTFNDIFPEPPGLDVYRAALRKQRMEQAEQREENANRDNVERRGSGG